METPDAQTLSNMPYSELKKLAKQRGIKGNLKAPRLIKAILSQNADDSFQSLENSIINSSRKNKEAKFDEDRKIVSDTPRRGTYSLDSPETEVLKERVSTAKKATLCGNIADLSFNTDSPMTEMLKKKECSHNVKNLAKEASQIHATDVDSPINRIMASIVVATTPALNKSSNANDSRITLTRGSERKTKSRKVSFVTPTRSPLVQATPHKYTSLKDRPKTPIASRVSSNRRVSFVTPNKSGKRSASFEKRKSQPSTPYPRGSVSNSRNSKQSLTSVAEDESKQLDTSVINAEAEVYHTPMTRCSPRLSSQKSVEQKIQKSAENKAIKNAIKAGGSAKAKGTPNFKKIHQKAFDNMESLDDYVKRKAANSSQKIGKPIERKPFVAKKAGTIKAFSGIPFIASNRSAKEKIPKAPFSNLKDDSFQLAKKKKMEKAAPKIKSSENSFVARITRSTSLPVKKDVPSKPARKLNESIRSKSKFDLQASLARKLPYKPHKGPLKPLSEVNLNRTVLGTSVCYHKKNEPENQTLKEIRNKTRDVLQGVRKNKRFDLQMKNRKL